jgi:HSP20 family molecular chaperone IbpA
MRTSPLRFNTEYVGKGLVVRSRDDARNGCGYHRIQRTEWRKEVWTVGESGWNPFDLKSWEQFFGGRMPGDPDAFNWVSHYVNDVMKESFQQPGSKKPAKMRLQTELFQTHNHVIVRLRIPATMEPKQLRVQAGIQRIRIEGLPHDGKQEIPLPSLVLPNTCRATYKDSILQIKLQKRRWKERYEEVFIRFT